MKIKPYFKIFVVISVLAFFSACKSYSIPYDHNLEGKTISTGLYVCNVPTPIVNYYSSVLLKTAFHSEDISKAYVEADIKNILYDEFLKNGNTISPKFKTALKTSSEKEIIINHSESANQSDPKVSEYTFEGVPEKLGKDYIFIIRIINYGMGEGNYSIYSTISYMASIIDMKTNKKIWQMKAEKQVTYPFEIILGYSTQKDVSKVRSNLTDGVVGIIKDISIDINKVQKK